VRKLKLLGHDQCRDQKDHVVARANMMGKSVTELEALFQERQIL